MIDAVSDNTAVKEAQRLGIKVLGLCDSNANPFWFDFPVPANDDGIKSIKIIAETILKAYAQGKKDGGSLAETKTEEVKETASEKPRSDAKKADSLETPIDGTIAEEAADIEEQIEKEVVADSERKVE